MWLRTALILGLTLCLSSPALAVRIRLQWDANHEPDLHGYRVYYSEDIPGPPWNGTQAVEGASPITYYVSGTSPIPGGWPIDNSGTTAGVTITHPNIPKADIEAGIRDIWFAVTAFDVEVYWDEEKGVTVYGRESGYSNQVHLGSVAPDGSSGPPHSIPGLRVVKTEPDTTPPFNIMRVSNTYLQAPTQDLPESGFVLVDIKEIPATWQAIEIHARIYDADYVDEGELYVNGAFALALFPAGSPVKDGTYTPEFFVLDVALFRPGPNVVEFRHTSTGGFILNDIRFEAKP